MILTITDRERELQAANAELRAELSALKQQPHIARATGKNSGDYSEVARVYETPLPDGVALYLAPGAQTVPGGMALVPIEPTAAMIRSYLVAQSTAAMQTDRAFGISDPMENFKAGYKAMLEAAKDKP